MLNKKEINKLREELDESILENKYYSIIYSISVKLDKLIAQYYLENGPKEEKAF